eukprot:GFUD01033172.1.p1 GENE.GFUD01033172.1~~GFUD01033172.1.p1  ORF type:complete len:4225 (-),score=861.78 GFUD01033172.1:307-12981(-)
MSPPSEVLQWLGLCEETILLQDGLLRLTDLVEVSPEALKLLDVQSKVQQILSLETKDSNELCEKIENLCKSESNGFGVLLKYRLNALKGLWKARKEWLTWEKDKGGVIEDAANTAVKQRKMNNTTPGQSTDGSTNFASKLSLLLIFPLIKSQTKLDPSLCGITTLLLLESLRECPPLSLRDPAECLNGLENLLSSWLGENDSGFVDQSKLTDSGQISTTASTLVALACARNSTKTVLHTLHLLQQIPSISCLPVYDLIYILGALDGGPSVPATPNGNKHILCWGFDDHLSGGLDNEEVEESEVAKKNLSSDGTFLFMTSYSGHGLAKIGTGLHGSLRGFVYAKNLNFTTGFVAFANGVLIQRPSSFDKESSPKMLATIVDMCTLEQGDDILQVPELDVESPGPIVTINLISNGMEFYWIRSINTNTENCQITSHSSYIIILDVFTVDPETKDVVVCRPRIILAKKEEHSPNKITGIENILRVSKPIRSSSTNSGLDHAYNAHIPLPPAVPQPQASSQQQNNVKDINSTSVGISYKTLVTCPMLTCGNYITIMSPPTTSPSPGNQIARSLFNNGQGLPSKTYGVCNSFSTKDGLFSSRHDLTDAHNSSLNKGATVATIGITFDTFNNCIWTASTDFVDQFHNTGHTAPSFTARKLGIPLNCIRPTTKEDNMATFQEICSTLIEHTGLMCFHYMSNELFSSACNILNDRPADVNHLKRVLHLLQNALDKNDTKTTLCLLVVIQMIMKTSSFDKLSEGEKTFVPTLHKLLWSITKSNKTKESLENTAIEACNAIITSFPVLYPTSQTKTELLTSLLSSSSVDAGMCYLRDLILDKFTEELSSNSTTNSRKRQIRESHELNHMILRITIVEAIQMIDLANSMDKEDYSRFLCTIPKTSPCLHYMSTLINGLLSDCILTESKEEKSQPIEKVLLRMFSDKIYDGGQQVLDAIQNVLETIDKKYDGDEREMRLLSIEKIVKSTAVGHVFLPLITSMSDSVFHDLDMCQNNILNQVQLVIRSCKIAHFLKSTTLKSVDPELNYVQDKVPEEQEEPGFMAGIKIPTPWATGKIVESGHPLRDNYKFKETIQIPGARCLYIRFDTRCASQYDYDKLALHAGPSTNSRKVGEYGGNTFGYGSRSVLGAGWPKDIMKIDGDTVTISFEMRSGREHNTPDKAMWGFKISVRAQEQEDSSTILPFMADLSLTLSALVCSNLEVLYGGRDLVKEELNCEHLLQSKLLQRCVWEKPRKVSGMYCIDEEIDNESFMELPRIKIPQDCIEKLRNLTSIKLPHLRPSVGKIIAPENMEEAIISTVAKHLSLTDVIRNLSTHEAENSLEYFSLIDIMVETYQKVNALIRKLQTIAELENHWENEVDDLREEMLKLSEAFFTNYCHDESKVKDLALICFLKDVDFDPKKPQKSSDELLKILENEANKPASNSEVSLAKTSTIVTGIMQRLELLLQVSIPNVFDQSKTLDTMTRSLQNWPSVGEAKSFKKQMSFDIEQSLDDSILQIPKLQLKRKIRKMKQTESTINYIGKGGDEDDKLPHSRLLDQLFDFIGSHPEKAVSTEDFLEAVNIRKVRGFNRKQALAMMKELLNAAVNVGGGTHLITAVAFLLQKGPRVNELTCGGVVDSVREAFAEIMTLVVNIASKYPLACKSSIAMLCIIPYSRSEERCLVRSGLVNLLDKLCSLSNEENCIEQKSETLSGKQELSIMAWAGFKVLANRCMEWQEEDSQEMCNISEELQCLGLAHQVSILLTNNLVRATNASNESADNESLQEILLLLNSLSKSKMGRDILSQPACVSKLLALLLEPRLSPKMILTIVQLCHVALPLMSSEGFDQVELPNWSLGNEEIYKHDANPSRKMISLILAKLADYLVPGCQVSAFQQVKDFEAVANDGKINAEDYDLAEDTVIPTDIPDMDRTLSLYLYKREDESAHEIIQQLLNASADLRLFRMTDNQNMEKIVNMDKELNKTNKTEVVTDDATVILRRAIKLAQQGFVVSVGPPQRVDEFSEEKKNAVEQVAKDRNTTLSKHDPVRPFVSSFVANNMASELISLIHSLFTSSTANIWAEAINDIITAALKNLHDIAEANDLIFSSNSNEIFKTYAMGREILAALAALGGHCKTLKPGSEVLILGEGIEECFAEIVSMSESTGQATIKLKVPNDISHYPRPSNIIQVPLDRLQGIEKTNAVTLFMPLADEILEAIQSLLVPDPTGVEPLSIALPAQGDGRSLKLATGRLIAEIRTRATGVLALYLKEPEFSCRFMQKSCQAVDMLKCLSKDCLPSDRREMVFSATEKLRNLYRDCIKPPAPPSRRNGAKHKIMVWDPSKTFPPLKSVLFTHNMLGITYYNEPALNTGQPRGILIYANQMIPPSANNFYWEVDILSLGDSPDDAGAPMISIGFAPLAEKKDGAWSNPVGTMFFHNNGRVVHYNGQSLLQWRSLRFDVQLNPGDTLGIGWEKLFDASANIPSSGTVYFTLNGVKLDQALEEVSGNMYPVVHIQKKNIRIKANFGSCKFAFAEGRVLQTKTLEHVSETTENINEEFGNMPFHSDGDSSGSQSPDRYVAGAGHRRINSYSCRTAMTPKALREYAPSMTDDVRSELCHDPCAKTGSHIQPITLLDDDSDSEDEDDDEDEIHHHEDINSLLVKSWEAKVFPIIRRRFRNETERKDGLEQIKGALSLGMADIARQTVEFLYEENGGIPRDLHLPTVEDIKEELSKFSIDRLKRGQSVIISSQTETDLSILPKYCIPVMLKTFGLPGEVLEIDIPNELVQVESYLRSEGILVRFWYPINVLEKPADCNKKTAVTGAQVVNINSSNVHKELMSWEYATTRINCREAYIKLIEQARDENLPNYVCVEENSSMATMIKSSIMLFHDIDIENLQYMSNHLLATPANGNMLERNLNITKSVNVLELEQGNASSLFYHDSSLLKMELNDALTRAGSQGEDYIIEMSNQVCVAMQLAPEFFTTEEILINDISTLKSCIQFPGAAFVAASVKVNKEIQDLKELKDLTIQIQTVDGIYVKNNGQISSRDIVQYPIDVAGYKDPLYAAFSPVIMATDKVRISHSGGEDMGFKLLLHAIPQQLPLAIVYIEEILDIAKQEIQGTVVKDKTIITAGSIHHIIEMIAGMIWRHEMPQVVKERILLMLAELIRCYLILATKSKINPQLPQMQMMGKFHQELKNLYECESSRKQHKRYSSYFQALFEVSLAISEATGAMAVVASKKSRSPTPASSSDREGSPALTHCHTSTLRRRLRLNSRRSRSGSSNSGHLISDSDSAVPVHIDNFWYQKAFTHANVLKYLVHGNPKDYENAMEFFKETYQTQLGPNDYTRLLVIRGIPRHMEPQQIKSTIHKLVNSFGGIFKDEIFILPISEMDNVNQPPANTETIVLEDIEDIDENAENEFIMEQIETTLQDRQRTTSYVEPVKPNNSGMAVVQIRTKSKLDKCKEELECNPILSQPGELDVERMDAYGLNVCRVNSSYHADDPLLDKILEAYLRYKLFMSDSSDLTHDCYNALEDIFLSCYMTDQKFNISENSDNESFIALKQPQILQQDEGNMMYTFFYGIKQTRRGLIEGVKEVLDQYGQACQKSAQKAMDIPTPPPRSRTSSAEKSPKQKEESISMRVVQETMIEKPESQEKTDACNENNISVVTSPRLSMDRDEIGLTLEGFMKFITEYARQDIRAVWMGLRSCGYDLHMERVFPTDSSHLQGLSSSWTNKQDQALIKFGNMIAAKFNISPLKICPNEIYLTEAEMASEEFNLLQSIAIEDLRTRFAILCSLNQGLEKFLIPLIDFRSAVVHLNSTAENIKKGRNLIFYETKSNLLTKYLNASHQRNPDHAPPEISVDPVEEIGNTNHDVCLSLFSQALNQLSEIQSNELNVSIAFGGDPQFPFNIKMVGDEVHGNSGSFRHFLSAIVDQLHSPTLNLLVPYRGTGSFTGRHFLKPGPLNYGEERMLQFFGQLLGISLRSGIPLPLNLMPTFWASLVNLPCLSWSECKELDPVSNLFLSNVESVTKEKFENFLDENSFPKFTYHSLNGEVVELCPGGVNISLTWENKAEYIESIKAHRIKEWESRDRFSHIVTGLGTIAPVSFIKNTFTPEDIELKFCGQPNVDLKFLKCHTIYQVGITPEDQHVLQFWAALESFTQSELAKFIKFACNQDRIPMVGPEESSHIPPYPMKIAPPDRSEGESDQQFIRVETCMFMIKLPRYTTYETMREKLLYAISCALDPLSG